MPETRGARMRRRREGLKMTAAELAVEAGMDVKTVKRAEEDHPGTSDKTWNRVEATLDRLEEEIAAASTARHVRTATMILPDGTRLVFEGSQPGEAADELSRFRHNEQLWRDGE